MRTSCKVLPIFFLLVLSALPGIGHAQDTPATLSASVDGADGEAILSVELTLADVTVEAFPFKNFESVSGTTLGMKPDDTLSIVETFAVTIDGEKRIPPLSVIADMFGVDTVSLYGSVEDFVVIVTGGQGAGSWTCNIRFIDGWLVSRKMIYDPFHGDAAEDTFYTHPITD